MECGISPPCTSPIKHSFTTKLIKVSTAADTGSNILVSFLLLRGKTKIESLQFPELLKVKEVEGQKDSLRVRQINYGSSNSHKIHRQTNNKILEKYK